MLAKVLAKQGKSIQCAGCDKPFGTLYKVEDGVYVHKGCKVKTPEQKKLSPLLGKAKLPLLYQARVQLPRIIRPGRQDARLDSPAR